MLINIKRVIKVYKNDNSLDGFKVKLDSDDIFEISMTSWNTADNHRDVDGEHYFQTPSGEIIFTQEQFQSV